MSDPFYFFSYFVSMCMGVRYMAENKSYVGVKLSDKARYRLLIFSFKEIKISVFAVISQIYLYAMLALFIVLKIVPPEAIGKVTNDPNGLLSKLVLIHFAVIFPVGMIESSICEWNYKRHR